TMPPCAAPSRSSPRWNINNIENCTVVVAADQHAGRLPHAEYILRNVLLQDCSCADRAAVTDATQTDNSRLRADPNTVADRRPTPVAARLDAHFLRYGAMPAQTTTAQRDAAQMTDVQATSDASRTSQPYVEGQTNVCGDQRIGGPPGRKKRPETELSACGD